MKSTSHELSEFDFNKAGNIAIINGQQGLHTTEHMLFKALVRGNHQPIVIDELFAFPERIKVLKLMNIETVVLGTTGTYRDKLDKAIAAFEKMDWLPKNAIFTMGENNFWKWDDKVTFFKIMPMQFSDDEIMIQKID